MLVRKIQKKQTSTKTTPVCSCGCGRKVYHAYILTKRALLLRYRNNSTIEHIYLACRAACSEKIALQRPELCATLRANIDANATKGHGSTPITRVFDAMDVAEGNNLKLHNTEFPNIEDFVDVYLAFGADLLERANIASHKQHYLSTLKEGARDTFLNRRHGMFSFLSDTTTLTFVKHAIEPNLMNGPNLLYNLVIGVVVLNSSKRFVHMLPLNINTPMTADHFKTKFEPQFGRRAPPKALLQGVQNILNRYQAGGHFENSALFVEDMGRKCPDTWLRIQEASGKANASELLLAALQDMGITPFAALVIARLLSLADPTLFDWDRYDIGLGAREGLALLAGKTGDAVKTYATKAEPESVWDLFAYLVEILPEKLRLKDAHGIIDKLTAHHMLPLVAQTVEHMLCEYRKVTASHSREKGGAKTPLDEYRALWCAAATTYKRHATIRTCA